MSVPWDKANLAKTTDYSLNRTLVNISKKWRDDWVYLDRKYWSKYYNAVEEELISRGYYE